MNYLSRSYGYNEFYIARLPDLPYRNVPFVHIGGSRVLTCEGQEGSDYTENEASPDRLSSSCFTAALLVTVGGEAGEGAKDVEENGPPRSPHRTRDGVGPEW